MDSGLETFYRVWRVSFSSEYNRHQGQGYKPSDGNISQMSPQLSQLSPHSLKTLGGTPYQSNKVLRETISIIEGKQKYSFYSNKYEKPYNR